MNRRSFLKSMTAAPVAMTVAPLAISVCVSMGNAPSLWILKSEGPLVLEGPVAGTMEYTLVPMGRGVVAVIGRNDTHA